MTRTINLSYILTTRNRLTFLKITLERLINELQPDEEVVVVDSNSTDGSKEYLQQLFEDGKIQQFISEPDRNQAHGWNKAMLMATGTVIKKIIDDDVFCYSAIRKCKEYMLQNPQVDVLISDDLSSELKNHLIIDKHSRLTQFNKWRGHKIPSFTFRDANMLMRRSSLAYIGLYNTSYIMMDWEYSLRISYIKAHITYYTGYNALTVAHPQTVTSTISKQQLDTEGKRGAIFYDYVGDDSEISYWSKLKILVGNAINKQKGAVSQNNNSNDEDICLIYARYYSYIDKLNQKDDFIFITSR